MEVDRIGASDVVTSTWGHRVCWKGRVDVACGQFRQRPVDELLNSARETHEFRSVNKEKNDPQELQRRGRAGRVRQGQLSKARQELTGADLAQRLWTLVHSCKRDGHKSGSRRFLRKSSRCSQNASRVHQPGVLRVQGGAPTRCCECA